MVAFWLNMSAIFFLFFMMKLFKSFLAKVKLNFLVQFKMGLSIGACSFHQKKKRKGIRHVCGEMQITPLTRFPRPLEFSYYSLFEYSLLYMWTAIFPLRLPQLDQDKSFINGQNLYSFITLLLSIDHSWEAVKCVVGHLQIHGILCVELGSRQMSLIWAGKHRFKTLTTKHTTL